MGLVQRSILFGLIALALTWAGLLVVAGLYALSLGLEDAARRGWLVWLGIAGFAAGNFVFMEIIADRLVRPARRWLPNTLELAAVLGLVGSALAGARAWFGASA